MKESIATSYLFTAVIVIIGMCVVIIVGGLNYTKAFKIKNRVIEIIEKYDGYVDSNKEETTEIKEFLKEAGYPILKDNNFKCPKGRGADVNGISEKNSGLNAINTIDGYKLCIYKYDTVNGPYYSVLTYMTYDFPGIGEFARIEIPLYGDTKIFTKL